MILDGRRRPRAAPAGGRAARRWSGSAERARPSARSALAAASSSASRSPSRWRTSRRCCSPTSRPASSTRDTAPRSSTLLRQRQPASWATTVVIVTHDPLVSEQVAAHGRHPRRPDEQRDAAARASVRRGRPPGHRRGVRRPRPRRAAPAAARARRGARAERRVRLRARGGPHRRLARRAREREGPMTERARAADRGRRRWSWPTGLVARLPVGRRRRPRAARRRPARRARPAGRRPRPLGLRQDDAAQPARRAGPADAGPRRGRRRRGERACARSSSSTFRRGDGRLHLPGLRPAARSCRRPRTSRCRCGSSAPSRARATRASRAARAGRPRAARAGTGRTSCPAASSSGWRSPARWPTGRKLLLADEPTGQLDSQTGHAIMGLLRTVVRTEGVTAVVATHDPGAARPGRSRGRDP